MNRADELRERTRRRVELVMMSDENFSAEFLQGVRADVTVWKWKRNSTSKTKKAAN